MKNKVVITTTSFAEYDPAPLTLLKEKGFIVTANTFGRRLNKNEILDMCSDSIGIVAGTEIYDQDTLKQLKNLRAISRCGSGMENIGLDSAKRLGIKVFNTPDAPILAVAELTVGLILALLRRITIMDSEIRIGAWKKRMGNLLSGKRIGIIGFGRIGKKAAELLKSIGGDVCYTDPIVKSKGDNTFSKVGFEELLRSSDIISLHLPYSKENHNLIGKREISLIRKGSFLVNTSRGGIIDENALYSALKVNKLAGVALDVFEKEPYNGPLKKLNNVILTPHIGSYAKEARIEMETKAVKNLLEALK